MAVRKDSHDAYAGRRVLFCHQKVMTERHPLLFCISFEPEIRADVGIADMDLKGLMKAHAADLHLTPETLHL